MPKEIISTTSIVHKDHQGYRNSAPKNIKCKLTEKKTALVGSRRLSQQAYTRRGVGRRIRGITNNCRQQYFVELVGRQWFTYPLNVSSDFSRLLTKACRSTWLRNKRNKLKNKKNKTKKGTRSMYLTACLIRRRAVVIIMLTSIFSATVWDSVPDIFFDESMNKNNQKNNKFRFWIKGKLREDDFSKSLVHYTVASQEKTKTPGMSNFFPSLFVVKYQHHEYCHIRKLTHL